MAVDPAGNVFVVGRLFHDQFPGLNAPGLLGTTNSGNSDVFVIAFNTNATAILYSGYLGGTDNDFGYGIAVDSPTNVYIVGQTASANFPVFNAKQPSLNGPSDAFLAKISGSVQAPLITTQPTNQLVESAVSVTFTVTAIGTPPLSYQWQFQGTNLVWTNLVNGGTNVSGGTHISGATNATLTISDPQTNNSGNYQVIVTNYAGSVTSSVAVLTVTDLPRITQQPTNQTVGVGSSAQFSIKGFATMPFSLQWLKDGIDLTDGTNLSGSIIIGSTNSATLTINNVQTNDQGNYWIIVTNNFGAVTSSVAVLTVVSFPMITVPPTNQTVGLGSTVLFTVTAVGAVPLSYQWQANGTNLAAGGTSAAA